jgi:CBS domain-containing protein
MTSKPNLVLAESLVTRDVLTFRPELPILDGLAVLREHRAPGAFVTDQAGRLVGAFSETDARRVLAQAAFYSVPVGTIGDHMTTELVRVTPRADVFQVVDLMRKHHLHRLPVCEDGVLVGAVTTHDVDAALWDMVRERERIDIPKPPPGAAWDPRISTAREARS